MQTVQTAPGVAEVLRSAKRMIEDPSKWSTQGQGGAIIGRDGTRCVLYAIVEAARLFRQGKGSKALQLGIWTDDLIATEAVMLVQRRIKNSIPAWNDDSRTHHFMVMNVLTDAIADAERQELEQTFALPSASLPTKLAIDTIQIVAEESNALIPA